MAKKMFSYKDINSTQVFNRKTYIKNKVNKSRQYLDFLPVSISENVLPDYGNKFAWSYKLVMYGTLHNGESAIVKVAGIKPYVYVRISKDYIDDSDGFIQLIRHKIKEYNPDAKTNIITEVSRQKEFIGFNKSALYVKFTTLKLSTRRLIIKAANELKCRMASDDAVFYKLPIRENNLTVSSWLRLKNFTISEGDSQFKYQDIYEVNFSDIAKVDKEEVLGDKNLSKNKSMIMGWDIECISKDNSLPVPYRQEDSIFMICMVFRWCGEKDFLLKVCLVDHPISSPKEEKLAKKGKLAEDDDVNDDIDLAAEDDEDVEFVTVVCGSEKNILRAFAMIFESMSPEYIAGYNDSGFDWIWLVNRAWQYGQDEGDETTLLEFMLQKMDKMHRSNLEYLYNEKMSYTTWNKQENQLYRKHKYASHDMKTAKNAYLSHVIRDYRKERIKIDAEMSIESYFLQCNGFVPFDVMTYFKQKYPKSKKYGLNYFLELNGLRSKKDMEISVMFKIYRRMVRAQQLGLACNTLKRKMRKIAEYCIIDAQRCLELIQLRNINTISNQRELADLSFTSIYDAYYRAGGMKVRNTIISDAQKRNFIVSNRSQYTSYAEKYPGALVLDPKTGLIAPKLTFKELSKDEGRPIITENEINIMERIISESSKSIFDKDEIKNLSDKFRAQQKNTSAEATEIFENFLSEQTGRPVAGLDFSSLYPHIIMTYNLSPEYMIFAGKSTSSKKRMEAEAEEARKNGHTLHKIQFMCNNEEVVAYSVSHDNKIDMKNPHSKNNKFGVFPTVLKRMYDMRKQMKKPAAYYEILREHIEKVNDKIRQFNAAVNYIKKNPRKLADYSAEEKTIAKLAALTDEYFVLAPFPDEKYSVDDAANVRLKTSMREICIEDAVNIISRRYPDKKSITKVLMKDIISFDEIERFFAYYDARQRSLKILMNTVYGESGNKISPFYILALAGGITSAGQNNLKYAKKICEDNGFDVIYGDTDSLYISPPNVVFTDLDRKYYSGAISKLDYCSDMINLTFVETEKIKDIINDSLERDNGTSFLRMAYEEVLYPAVFISKKKYYGLPHVNVPNFDVNRNIFTKGIESEKVNASQILKNILDDKVIRTSLTLQNTKNLSQIIKESIVAFYNTEWPIDCFILNDRYKPVSDEDRECGKGNTKVLTFADRMRAKNIKLTPYDRFDYAIVETHPYDYDHRGRIRHLQIGEKMELMETIKKDKDLRIDRNYYINGIIRQLAKILTYDTRFYVEPADDSDEAIKKANDKMRDNAEKYLKEFIKERGFGSTYFKLGKIKKRIFKTSQLLIQKQLLNYIDSKYTQNILTNWRDTPAKSTERFVKSIENQMIKEYKDPGIKIYIDYLCEKESYTYNEATSLLINRYKKDTHISKKIDIILGKKILVARHKLSDICMSLATFMNKYQDIIINISNIIDSKVKKYDICYAPADKAKIVQFNKIMEDSIKSIDNIPKGEIIDIIDREIKKHIDFADIQYLSNKINSIYTRLYYLLQIQHHTNIMRDHAQDLYSKKYTNLTENTVCTEDRRDQFMEQLDRELGELEIT